mgnify:CR=1
MPLLCPSNQTSTTFKAKVVTAKEMKEHLADIPDDFVWETDCDGEEGTIHFYKPGTRTAYILRHED